MPSNFFMPDLLLSSLCAVFNRVANVDDWQDLDEAELKKLVPDAHLAGWCPAG